MTVSRARLTNYSPEFSRLIAGFWRLNDWRMDKQALLAFIEQCLDLGITTMDHALVYKSEAPFGEALALKPELRQKMEIMTKCGIRPCNFGSLGARSVNHYDSSKQHIIESVENSLTTLKTDYLDLLLIHRPDYLMNADEIADAFTSLQEQGKVKTFGVSNFNTHQCELLQQAFGNKLVTNQVEFSPYCMGALESGVLDQCQQSGIAPMFWSCLAGGRILTSDEAKAVRIRKALSTVAEELGASGIEAVIFAWILALPCRPFPILGTSKIARIKIALEAEKFSLNREQWYRIWEAATGHRVP